MLVRSGAYEVDLPRRQLRPCYWPASRHRCLRGTWFAEKGGEWVPLKVCGVDGGAGCQGGAAATERRSALAGLIIVPPSSAAGGRDLLPPTPCLAASCHCHRRPSALLCRHCTAASSPQESLAEQVEEGFRQALWLPQRGRLAAQPGGGYASRLELTTAVEKGLYALFASGEVGHGAVGGVQTVAASPSRFLPHLVAPGSAASLLALLQPAPTLLSAEDEVFLCQETGWGWLRKIGASASAGQQRLRLRRGYEQPASRVGAGLGAARMRHVACRANRDAVPTLAEEPWLQGAACSCPLAAPSGLECARLPTRCHGAAACPLHRLCWRRRRTCGRRSSTRKLRAHLCPAWF